MGLSIQVMADYDCWPLWHYKNAEVGNIDPVSLPLSHDLQNALLTWAAQFDSTLNREDPASTGWSTPEARHNFIEIGRRLATRVKEELGPGNLVVYFNDATREVEAE